MKIVLDISGCGKCPFSRLDNIVEDYCTISCCYEEENKIFEFTEIKNVDYNTYFNCPIKLENFIDYD